MTRIGFIGVGTMGLPMAANLVKKGFAVTAFDLNTEAVKAAVAAGMTAAASAAEAVAAADIVVTMLPSSPHVESVYGGDGGVITAARKGTLCIDMSTVDPAASRRVAAAAAECREGRRGPSTAPSPSWWEPPGPISRRPCPLSRPWART